MNKRLDGRLLLNKAIEMSSRAHYNQKRKCSEIPYIVHPFEVALILQENGGDEQVIIAGILHDTLEDTSIKTDNIKNIFGNEILELVLGASEELKDRDTRPWKDRKLHTIEYLKTAPFKVKLIACADKLSNIRSMIRDYNNSGDELWKKFNAPFPEQSWYYNGLVDSLKELKGYKMYEEFKESVKYLFGS